MAQVIKYLRFGRLEQLGSPGLGLTTPDHAIAIIIHPTNYQNNIAMILEDTVFVQTVEAGWIPEPPPPVNAQAPPNKEIPNESPEPEERTIEEWAGRFFYRVNRIIGLEHDKKKTA
ncbi:uncharacterized protein DFL_000315 [Arthrobotrys flagrans]|uniref:Uncharacterized protein n=1 Tax=Arthrobotrys flagrans TaxID=97331 RepID=A0A437AF22_ARTFL|nr:hypothetical protein DFL_000315 [Arthrobotrys flagrans]